MNPVPSMLSLLILAIVQGVTEFLPISSSGHLVLIRKAFGWSDEGGLAVDIVLHAGSLAAILVYFWRTWRGILGAWRNRADPARAEHRRLPGLLLLATLPILAVGAPLSFLKIGAPLKPVLESAAIRNGITVGLGMMATALLFCFCDRHTPTTPRPAGIRQALAAGLMQVVALLPGVSRSGWTTAGSLLAGQSREAAVRFAFFMAIPAIACAMGKPGLDLIRGQPFLEPAWMLALGFCVSFLVSLAAIHFCLLFFRRHTFRVFSLYLAAAGLATLLLSF